MGIYTIKSHIIYSNAAIDITNIKAIDWHTKLLY
jgi:hypothetical protein